MAKNYRNRILANHANGYLGLCLSAFFEFESGAHCWWYFNFSSFGMGLSVPFAHKLHPVFLEELWSRNLGNLFVSPLRPSELIIALASISMMRTLIGMLPAALLAIPFFGVSVFDMGFPLLGFFLNLVLTGWAISQFVTGILIRYGLGAESLTWVLPFLIAPFSCIYYPLSTLPDWMQSIAVFIPTTYVFEGMRALLLDEVFRTDLMIKGFSLNIAYLIAGVCVFFASFKAARRHGLLLQSGE